MVLILSIFSGLIRDCPRRGESRLLRASAFSPTGSGSRQSEIEGGALVQLPFCPHPPAVPLHDSLDDRETDSRALEFLRAVQPLEHAEQFVGVAGVEAGAVVLHIIHGLAAVRPGPHFDARTVLA